MKNKMLGKILIIAMLIGIANVSFADRGAGKKSKVKTVLNITTTPGASFKTSLLSNFKAGLVYKGTLLSNTSASSSNHTTMASSLITFQKGNTTYIIPYKNKNCGTRNAAGICWCKIDYQEQSLKYNIFNKKALTVLRLFYWVSGPY